MSKTFPTATILSGRERFVVLRRAERAGKCNADLPAGSGTLFPSLVVGQSGSTGTTIDNASSQKMLVVDPERFLTTV